MRFIHMSDLHLRVDYRTNAFTDRFFKTIDPVQQSRDLFQRVKDEEVDFVLLTGDIAHEGTPEDYELFLELWDEYLSDVPYFFCRGNHDRIDSFVKGMQIDESKVLGESYVDCAEFKGLRIVTLDTAQEHDHEGRISEEQFEYLKEKVSTPAPLGTVLLVHHPIFWWEDHIETHVPDGFYDWLETSDIRAIFLGHIHQASNAVYKNIPQVMAESVAFGVDEYPDHSVFTNRTGFNRGTIDKDKLVIQHELLQPKTRVLGQVSKPIDGNY